MAYVGPLRAMIQLFKDDADVFAETSTRIRKGKAAAGDRAAGDYLVLNRIGGVHYEHFNGSSGLGEALIQVDGYSSGKQSVEDLPELLRLAIQRRAPGDVTVGGDTIDVRCISLQGERDTHEDPRDGSDVGISGFSQDWLIAFIEAIP